MHDQGVRVVNKTAFRRAGDEPRGWTISLVQYPISKEHSLARRHDARTVLVLLPLSVAPYREFDRVITAGVTTNPSASRGLATTASAWPSSAIEATVTYALCRTSGVRSPSLTEFSRLARYSTMLNGECQLRAGQKLQRNAPSHDRRILQPARPPLALVVLIPVGLVDDFF